MAQGFGHPPQWDHQLPRMNDLLASVPPPTRVGTVSTLLPPPNKDLGVHNYVGGQSLAQYRSPWAGERLPQGRRQDGLQAGSPITHPPTHQVHDRGHITHESASGRRISYPLHPSSNAPLQNREPGATHPTYPPFRAVADFNVNGDSKLRPTRSLQDPRTTGGAPSSPPVEQSSRSKPATEMTMESPWGFTKAGKARKRLEQACVSCRKKKTKCEPMSSSSKCLPCEKNGSECYFDSA
jgi:hypothetical protein